MRRSDLSAGRPWFPRPRQPGIDSAWEVVAPSHYLGSKPSAFLHMLSEEDARAISVAHEAVALARKVADGADPVELLRMATEVLQKHEGFDPAADDEAQARMERDS